MKRAWSWSSFAAGAAAAGVILGGTWAGVAVAQADAQRQQEAYVQCLNDLGFVQGDPDVDLEELAIAAEACSS